MEKNTTPNELPFCVYDCFTDEKFGGNIGVLVWNAQVLNKVQMSKIAKEFNAPVSGFVLSKEANIISVRFFMPTSEIDMCGHVTIGLFTELSRNQINKEKKYILNTPNSSIEIIVNKNQNNIPTVMFSLELPKKIKVNAEVEAIAKALNITINDINPTIPIGAYNAGLKHLFVNINNERILNSISPKFDDLKNISNKLGIQTIACFFVKTSNDSVNLHVRDFCPALGVNETPASGTTNGALTGYLIENKLIKPISQKIISHQGYEIERPSKVISIIEVKNGVITNLKVGGNAILNYFGKIKFQKN